MVRRGLLTLENLSGYATTDLVDWFSTFMAREGVREPKSIIVYAAPSRSRGCAEVGPDKSGLASRPRRKEGEKVVFSIAAPWRFRLRRWYNLNRHEFAHSVDGLEHEEMPEDVEWSMCTVPAWARRFDRPGWPRHVGRAPAQL